MIKTILWDIDGTLLNFLAAENRAIKACFAKFQLGACTDEMVARYSEINKRYWEKLERRELSKQEVLLGRFEEFFALENIQTDCTAEFNREYQLFLGDTICFNDNSFELLSVLRSRVKQYAVTNGTKVAQSKKLDRSGLIRIFDDVFISEDVGVEKPDIGFFEHVLAKIGAQKSNEVMIVGDSLTSDMQGGNNAGILCCWYNPNHLPLTKELKIDYEIDDLWKISDILLFEAMNGRKGK